MQLCHQPGHKKGTLSDDILLYTLWTLEQYEKNIVPLNIPFGVRELDLAMCFPIFEWQQDEKPLDQLEEVLMRKRQEP